MNGDADFAGLPPIKLPDGRKLETLVDLRAYILALPDAQQPRRERTVAMLLQAASGRPVPVHRTSGVRTDLTRH